MVEQQRLAGLALEHLQAQPPPLRTSSAGSARGREAGAHREPQLDQARPVQ